MTSDERPILQTCTLNIYVWRKQKLVRLKTEHFDNPLSALRWTSTTFIRGNVGESSIGRFECIVDGHRQWTLEVH